MGPSGELSDTEILETLNKTARIAANPKDTSRWLFTDYVNACKLAWQGIYDAPVKTIQDSLALAGGLRKYVDDCFKDKTFADLREYAKEQQQLERSLGGFYAERDNYRIALEPALLRLVQGEARLGTWALAKDVDQTHALHVERLSLPHVKGLDTTPSLLLHGLGNHCGDPTLEARLGEYFARKHAYVCNASGSGKTRLLLEGLCMHWGLYFTCLKSAHGIGSEDLHSMLHKIGEAPHFHDNLGRKPEYRLADNVGVVHQFILPLLYARLYVLKVFLDCLPPPPWTSTEENEYRRKWLILQLDPTIIKSTEGPAPSGDVFHDMVKILVDTCPIRALSGLVNALKAEILPQPTGGQGLIGPDFYVVLDEVQTVSAKHHGAFRSDKSLDVPRSLLRQVVATFKEKLMPSAHIIPTGTNLSATELHEAIGSTLGLPFEERHKRYTGGFDTLQSIYRYSKLYFPPTMQRGDACMRLIWRMGIWLTGRHRFVAGYLVRLLQNGFASPHRVLNAYVSKHTGFTPSDADDCVRDEPPLPPSHLALSAEETMLKDINWSAITRNEGNNRIVQSQIRGLVLNRLLRSSQTVCMSSTQARDMVQLGFARYVTLKLPDEDEDEESLPIQWRPNDSEDDTALADDEGPASAARAQIPGGDSDVVVISEPLVLLRLAKGMDDFAGSCTYNFLAGKIKEKSADENGWENFVAHSLIRLFSAEKKNSLSDIFDLRQARGTLPNGTVGWVDDVRYAELMSLSGTVVAAVRGWDNKLLTIGELIDDHRPGVPPEEAGNPPKRLRPTCNSGQRADNVVGVLSWFRKNSAPILFPSNLMGPDIFFLVRLSNGELMWIAVQCKYDTPQALTFKSSSKIIKGAVRSVTPEFFFMPKEGESQEGKPALRRDVVLERMKLPRRTNLAGTHGVLRVIACFPSVVPLNEMDDPDTGDHPLVMLNCSKLQDAFKDLDPADAIQAWVAHAEDKIKQTAEARNAHAELKELGKSARLDPPPGWLEHADARSRSPRVIPPTGRSNTDWPEVAQDPPPSGAHHRSASYTTATTNYQGSHYSGATGDHYPSESSVRDDTGASSISAPYGSEWDYDDYDGSASVDVADIARRAQRSEQKLDPHIRAGSMPINLPSGAGHSTAPHSHLAQTRQGPRANREVAAPYPQAANLESHFVAPPMIHSSSAEERAYQGRGAHDGARAHSVAYGQAHFPQNLMSGLSHAGPYANAQIGPMQMGSQRTQHSLGISDARSVPSASATYERGVDGRLRSAQQPSYPHTALPQSSRFNAHPTSGYHEPLPDRYAHTVAPTPYIDAHPDTSDASGTFYYADGHRQPTLAYANQFTNSSHALVDPSPQLYPAPQEDVHAPAEPHHDVYGSEHEYSPSPDAGASWPVERYPGDVPHVAGERYSPAPAQDAHLPPESEPREQFINPFAPDFEAGTQTTPPQTTHYSDGYHSGHGQPEAYEGYLGQTSVQHGHREQRGYGEQQDYFTPAPPYPPTLPAHQQHAGAAPHAPHTSQTHLPAGHDRTVDWAMHGQPQAYHTAPAAHRGHWYASPQAYGGAPQQQRSVYAESYAPPMAPAVAAPPSAPGQMWARPARGSYVPQIAQALYYPVGHGGGGGGGGGSAPSQPPTSQAHAIAGPSQAAQANFVLQQPPPPRAIPKRQATSEARIPTPDFDTQRRRGEQKRRKFQG